MIQNLTRRIESCRQLVNGVAKSSEHFPADSQGARTGSVQENAEIYQEGKAEKKTATGRVDDINWEADISELAQGKVNTALNMLLLWKSTLEEASQEMKTSTTSTELETTTDWKTLNYCLLRITPGSIIQDECHQGGLSANAYTAAKYFSAVLLKLKTIQELSAIENVMSEAQASRLGDPELAPSYEPIILARKPLIGTVAENVLKHRTGGINIESSRIMTGEENPSIKRRLSKPPINNVWEDKRSPESYKQERPGEQLGRWPANLIHDNSPEVVDCFPETTICSGPKKTTHNTGMFNAGTPGHTYNKDDKGNQCAARFFKSCPYDTEDIEDYKRIAYFAKASKRDRDKGCEGIEWRKSGMSNGAQINGEGYDKGQSIGLNRVIARRNHHPTVKPTALMQYLCKLITPPKGKILDLFAGSGSTGKAAVLEGFKVILIEKEKEYISIIKARLKAAEKKSKLPKQTALF
jgi:hypothetical protein